jgi:hypothetical protein
MFKRIFWLALAVLAGWIAWRWLQQREAAFDDAAPQLPLEPLPLAEWPAVAPAPQSTMLAEPAAMAPAPQSATPDAVDVDVAEVAEVAEVAAPAEAAHADDVMPAQASAEAAVEAAAPDDALGEVVGYCVRCKTKRAISDAHEDTTESGRRAARGVCPVCGAKMFTFLPTD